MNLKIGVSAWSFHRRFLAKPPTMDYPQFFAAVRGLDIDTVELNSPFFVSQEDDYIISLKKAADSYGVHINNIAIDDGGYDLSSADSANREEAISRTVRWMDIAVMLDCPHVRNNTGGPHEGGDPDALARCTDSFAVRRSRPLLFAHLAAEAEKRGLCMVIENHGGISANPDELVSLIRKVDSKFIGIVPDFGNFRPDIRYEAIEKVAPFAKQIHPKMHDFDERGEQPGWDTAKLVNIIKKTGFDGYWVIEFEGQEEEFSGLRKSIALLSRCLSE